MMVLQETGGAIVAIAPTGLSRSDQAHILNMELVATGFLTGKVTLGEAMSLALQGLADQNGDRFMLELYSLIGDPALRLGKGL